MALLLKSAKILLSFQDDEGISSPDNTPSKQSTMRKRPGSLDRKVQLITAKDLGDPDELKDVTGKDAEAAAAAASGLNAVNEDDSSAGEAEEGTLLKVCLFILQ